MNLHDLIVLILILCFIAMFWRFRAISEQVKVSLEHYCETHNIQLISVARVSTRIKSYRGKLDFHTEFYFEFSGNGEDSYRGRILMIGLRSVKVETPAYKID
ncbi:DUF3301 domain-containing protein [uncultured Paraglaciecola sp.]|uniref:DUF3301 domain-containing protein n=1 Tax=uncultured Paraglaciecola sp. TaxID=1765024 RepID=UPI002599DB57|nr:DUF3301 domain-containing protein [uncultured Paraglaciecola sp.]